jgi:hypothetical protein
MKRYAGWLLALLLLAGCSQLQQAGQRYVLTEFEIAKLEYTTLSNDYAVARETIRQQRVAGEIDDNGWAAFVTLQQEVQDVAIELINLRKGWEASGTKPQRWDGAMSELRSKIESVEALAR